MPATREDVANQALTLLTEAPITSLDEDVRAARLLSIHWDTVVESELMLNPWAFAAVFPDDIDATDTGQDGVYQYLYEIPGDFLRPIWLTRDGKPDGVPLNWSRWGDGIRSDFSGPLVMPYIANVIDPAEWNALFTRAVAAALALPIAHAMTGKANLIQIAQAAYDRAVSDARRINAIMKIGRQPETSWAVQRGDTRYVRA